MQHRKWTLFLMAITFVVAWSFQAQALSINLDSSRRAKFYQSGDTVVFSGKRSGARGAFTVTLDNPGSVDVLVKRRGKRARRSTLTLAAGTYQYAAGGRKKVVMSFSEAGTTVPPSVPEPGTLALMGLGLAGLAYRGRRRN